MAHHCWGKWPDELFAQVGQAADEIGKFCRKWGRINVTCTKEKYGTARVYCSFGYLSLHSLIYPGYCYSQFPKWLWTLDIFVISRVFSFLRLNQLVFYYQKWIYKTAYRRALKKFPQITEEIICGADWPEFFLTSEETIRRLEKRLEYEQDRHFKMIDEITEETNKKASDAVMDLYYALKAIKGTPTLKDLVKLAKRIKKG